MKRQDFKNYSPEENETWQRLYRNLENCRSSQAHPLFVKGLGKLGFSGDHIPDLDQINSILKENTGWVGVPVEGLEDGPSFYSALSRSEFPIGNFIREPQDLSYTPEPDIFHDLYGHIPLFADKDYAEFNQKFGALAMKFADDPERFRIFERVYWFGVEFPLIETETGDKIFGGGILSSQGESNYSLSDEPEVLPFSLEAVASQEFRIDQMQKRIFKLSNVEQLYGCLNELEQIAISGVSEVTPIVN